MAVFCTTRIHGMTLTDERVQLALAPRPVRFFESVGSTNDTAMAWLREGALNGAVVVADEQTAGRGRHGRAWHTPPNVALALSVVLRNIAPEHLPQVNMVGTLAVADTLTMLHVKDVAIKWANDVLVGGKKISGILPEAAWDGDTLSGVVLGMGVNVRNDFAGTPLEDTATTIETVTGREQDRAALMAVLLLKLDDWLGKLGTPDVRRAYQAQMTMLGKPITLTTDEGEISGTARAVGADGGLEIEQAGGEITRVFAGDVRTSS
jgi:BirA family biotin operon repressor/biotin-[acetyl-CoA-carboxylase] ligase